jgi:aspartate 1-decarboxylase
VQRFMCKSKIHRARISDTNLDYEGSLTVDMDLLDAADMLPYEKVQVVNINNGSRAETYLMQGNRGSGDVIVNGALARLAQKNDLIIIISYALFDAGELHSFKPKIIRVDTANRIVSN